MPNSYHFSLGNSNQGPIGFCARIDAPSEEEAVETLRAALNSLAGDLGEITLTSSTPGVEYIAVYLNPDAITTADITGE